MDVEQVKTAARSVLSNHSSNNCLGLADFRRKVADKLNENDGELNVDPDADGFRILLQLATRKDKTNGEPDAIKECGDGKVFCRRGG
jgi:hypothetical protein